MAGRGSGHNRPLLLILVVVDKAALGEDVGHVEPPVRAMGPLVVIGLGGHAHLVRRQPATASNFVRGIVKPSRLHCRQPEPLGENGLLLRIQNRDNFVVLDRQLRLRQRGHLVLGQASDVPLIRDGLGLWSSLLLLPSSPWLL